MHKHQNDKNEMPISCLNIPRLYSSFPRGRWTVYFFFFAPAWMMIELKHNNVKSQIESPYFPRPFFFFFPFAVILHPLYLIHVCLNVWSFLDRGEDDLDMWVMIVYWTCGKQLLIKKKQKPKKQKKHLRAANQHLWELKLKTSSYK